MNLESVKDKGLLIATGLFGVGFVFVANYYLRPLLNYEWFLFTMASLGYLSVLFYCGIFYLKGFKGTRSIFIVYLSVYYAVTTGVALILFHSQLFPLPSRFGIYTIFIIMLSIGAFIFYEIVFNSKKQAK